MNQELFRDILFLADGTVIDIELSLDELLSDYKIPEYFLDNTYYDERTRDIISYAQ